jgi:D-tyrosyl-tRNA(Tyr) deacylase
MRRGGCDRRKTIMKAWIQRVTEASVEIGGERVAEIGQGYLVLLGVTHSDTEKSADEMAERICNLRIFEDENGKTNRSLIDVAGSVIVVSQFTLYADTSHGRRPGFSNAARPELAEPLYERVASDLRGRLGAGRVGTGRFGAEMKVRLVNDGPFSVELLS